MERKLKISNKELKDLLQQRNKLVLEGRKNNEKKEKLETSINKAAMELQKIDGKAGKIIEKLDLKMEKTMDKFEMITQIALRDDKIEITIVDRIKELAQQLLKKEDEVKTQKEEVKKSVDTIVKK